MNEGLLLLSGNADGGERFPAVAAGRPSEISTATREPPSTLHTTLHNADDLLMNGELLGQEIRPRRGISTFLHIAHVRCCSGSGYGRGAIDWEGTTPAHDCQRGADARAACATMLTNAIDKRVTRVLSSQMHTLATGNKPIAVPESQRRRTSTELRRA